MTLSISAVDKVGVVLISNASENSLPTVEPRLRMNSPNSEVKTEFLVYGRNDFTADVGGYLGLLLGHSVLSFYDGFISLATKLWAKVEKKFIKKDQIA